MAFLKHFLILQNSGLDGVINISVVLLTIFAAAGISVNL